MGIHNLTGFIDKNQQLLNEHQLYNTSVVIDGNNLYHFLYGAYHVQCSFGGDYDIYRQSIITTFDSFRRCGITPYVVMDGAYTRDGRKLKTSLARAASRIQLIKAMVYHQRGHVLPALAYETFMQTLTELGIPHATCQFEADAEIAVLANKLKCPVISNDSDFYIFDLSNGFLPLDYIDFRPLKSGESGEIKSYNYFHCRIYHVDDFINSFDGLSRAVLPVFASLLGNDYIQTSSFDAFYSKFKVPKLVSKKFSLPPRLAKVISVLHWLDNHVEHNDVSVIKSQILSFINPKSKRNVERKFMSSVNGYIDINNFNGFDLLNFLTGSSEDWHTHPDPDFSLYNGSPFPEWFLKSVCKGEIPSTVLNVSISHRVIIPSQVEKLNSPASCFCSAYLRKVLYSVLMKEDPPTIGPQNIDKMDWLTPANDVELKSFLDNQLTTEHADQEDEDLRIAHNESYTNENNSQDETLIEKCCQYSSQRQEHKAADETSEVTPTEDKLVDEAETLADPVVEEDASGPKTVGPFRLKQVCIEEYIRNGRNLKKFYIEPLDKIGDLSVPGLSELLTMSSDSRKTILATALQVDLEFLDSFPRDMQLFMACVVHWIRNAVPKVTVTHMECVLLSSIFLKILIHLKENKKIKMSEQHKECSWKEDCNENSIQGDADCESTLDIDITCLNSKVEILKSIKKNLGKYHKKSPVFNRNNHFDPEIIHGFAQLQSCILDALSLNRVLRSPLNSLRPSELINGTFLYNIFSDLQTRPNPELFLAAMLSNDSQLCKVFQEMRGLVIKTAGMDYFQPQSSVKRKAKRQKGRKEKQKNAISKSEALSHSSSSDDEVGMITVAGFDINNRFNALCLDS